MSSPAPIAPVAPHPTPANPPAGGSGQRLHGMDALRAVALLLGVLFHAAVTFLHVDGFLPFDDDTRSPLLAALYIVLHLFRMTAFYLVAGYFARLLLRRRGERAFIRDRVRRILAPLLVFYPLTAALLVAGLLLYFRGDTSGPAFHPEKTVVPATHLWFLWYLLLYYALALTARRALPASTGPLLERLTTLLTARGGWLLLGLPATAALLLTPDWRPWLGIPSPLEFTPELAPLTAYGVAFTFGWLLHRRPERLHALAARWPEHALPGLIGAAVLIGMLGLTPTSGPYAGRQLLIALLTTLSGWSLALPLLGVCLTSLRDFRPVWRYLSDASYWVYLTHLPLLFVLQALVAHWPLPALLKFAFLVVITYALTLASYQLFVRSTRLGAWLNGSRRGRRAARRAGVQAPTLAAEPS